MNFGKPQNGWKAFLYNLGDINIEFMKKKERKKYNKKRRTKINKREVQDGVGTIIVLIWNSSTENLDHLDKIIAPETRNKGSLHCPNTTLFSK